MICDWQMHTYPKVTTGHSFNYWVFMKIALLFGRAMKCYIAVSAHSTQSSKCLTIRWSVHAENSYVIKNYNAILGDGAAAHHQNAGAPEQVAAHVDAALMLLRHSVIEEQGQVQRGADGGKASVIHGPAILGRLFRDFAGIAAPCGGYIGEGSLHIKNASFFIFSRWGTVNPIPPPFPIHGKGGGSGGYIPRRAGRGGTAGAGRQGQAAAGGGRSAP